MGVSIFTTKDFQVFAIPDFHGRMEAIRVQIRPKLNDLGTALLPEIARIVGSEVFAHVAKHARRTVNPLEDTWVAFGPDRRGYKKDVHFKVAVSRNCIRFLFEVGPEYHDKGKWTTIWERRQNDIIKIFKGTQGIGWFKNEHDDDPATLMKDLTQAEIRQLGQELSRRRDGQLVFGRRLSQFEVTGMRPEEFQRAALKTFEVMVPLYRLR